MTTASRFAHAGANAPTDTFGRVFQLIDSQVLEKVCIDWLQSIAGQVQGVVAIDGKSVRGSRSATQAPLL